MSTPFWDGRITKSLEGAIPVYSVSATIADLLNAADAPLISFDLGLACEHGINVAIMARFLRHVISRSPNGVAYNLKVKEMADANRLSPASIYRAITFLEENEVVTRVKSSVRGSGKSLTLTLCKPKRTANA
jgi:hypothetical protein